MKVGAMAVALATCALVAPADAGSIREGLMAKLKSKALERVNAPKICEDFIYKQEMKGQFSSCVAEDNVKGQGGVDCSQFDGDYQACAGNQACVYFHLGDRKPQCLANPCFRINDSTCTIQNTGGRCVWYTKEQNKELRGNNNPGCYKSPCSNPLDNSPEGCAAKSNQFYKCTWCPKVSRKKPWGCMNAKESSTAQCWAVGGKDSLPGCGESCMAKDGDTGPCQSEKCRANCCQSPLCLCMGGGRSTGDTALSIGNT